MKLATVSVNGRHTWGICTQDGFIDIGAQQPRSATLRDLIESRDMHDVLSSAGGPTIALEDLEYLPVIPDPRQIFCVGLNYGAHRRETGRDETERPTIFLRLPSSQVGHQQPLVIPRESVKLDYEGELAVIIGTGGRRIAADDAIDHVFGYSCYNDASVRDWQNHTTQWTPGKNFVGTGSFGPYLVTPDEVSSIFESSLVTLVNGEERQRAKIADMTTPIGDVIAYVSTFTPLYPGDVICTGTPGGVGSRLTPPAFLEAGDVVEILIDDVGVLRNNVVAES